MNANLIDHLRAVIVFVEANPLLPPLSVTANNYDVLGQPSLNGDRLEAVADIAATLGLPVEVGPWVEGEARWRSHSVRVPLVGLTFTIFAHEQVPAEVPA